MGQFDLARHHRRRTFLESAYHFSIRIRIDEFAVLGLVSEKSMSRMAVLLVRFIKREEHDRSGITRSAEHLAALFLGSRALVERPVEADDRLGPARQFDVDVRAQLKPVQLDIVIEIIPAVLLQNALIPQKIGGQIILYGLTASGDIHAVTLIDGKILHHVIVPIDRRIKHRILFKLRIQDLRGRIGHHLFRTPSCPHSLVVQLHIGNRIGQLHEARVHGGRDFGPDRKPHTLLHSALGCHQNNSVRTARTVQGCSAGIFHNRKTPDVIHIETGQIGGAHFDSVDQNQRVFFTGAERSHSANEKFGVVESWLSRTLVCNHTCQLTGKSARKVAGRNTQLPGVDGRHGCDDALLLLRSESHDHNILNLLRLGLKDHRKAVRLFCQNLLGLITDIGIHDDVLGIYIQFIFSLGVRGDTFGGALYRNGDAHQRKAVGIDHPAGQFHRLRRLCRGKSRHDEQQRETKGPEGHCYWLSFHRFIVLKIGLIVHRMGIHSTNSIQRSIRLAEINEYAAAHSFEIGKIAVVIVEIHNNRIDVFARFRRIFPLQHFQQFIIINAVPHRFKPDRRV